MCRGFGAVVTIKNELWFTFPSLDGDCSHTDIHGLMSRYSLHGRAGPYAEVECPDWTIESFDQISRHGMNKSVPYALTDAVLKALGPEVPHLGAQLYMLYVSYVDQGWGRSKNGGFIPLEQPRADYTDNAEKIWNKLKALMIGVPGCLYYCEGSMLKPVPFVIEVR